MTDVIDDYATNPGKDLASSGAQIAATLALFLEEVRLQDMTPFVEVGPENRFFGETSGAVIRWSGPVRLTFSPVTQLDLRDKHALTVRVAQQPRQPNPNVPDPLNFVVTLIDADGKTSSVSTTFSDPVGAVHVTKIGFRDTTDAVFQTVSIDIDRFNVGCVIDLARIQAIRLEFGVTGTSPNGWIGIDDLEVVP